MFKSRSGDYTSDWLTFLVDMKESTRIREQFYTDPLSAVGAGYGESKWLASQLLRIAGERTALQPVVVRVGQICGNTINGHWNPSEWFPTIVRSHSAVGCLPDAEGVRIRPILVC